MLAAAFNFSTLGLHVAWAAAGARPALFNAVWRCGGLAGFLAYLLVRFPGIFQFRILRLIFGILLSRRGRLPFFLMLLSGLDFFFFSWSTRYVNVAVAAALFELWPLASALLLGLTAGRRPGVLLGRAAGPGLLCLLGLTLALAAQVGGPRGLAQVLGAGPPGALLAGGGLALLAGVAGGFSVLGIYCGRLAAGERRLQRLAAALGVGRTELARAGTMLIFSCIGLGSIPVFLALALGGGAGAAGEYAFSWWGLQVLAGGGLVLTGTGLLWREANARAAGPGVNLWGCLGPFGGLGLLAAFGYAEGVSGEWLLGGLGLVVAGSVWAQRRLAGS